MRFSLIFACAVLTLACFAAWILQLHHRLSLTEQSNMELTEQLTTFEPNVERDVNYLRLTMAHPNVEEEQLLAAFGKTLFPRQLSEEGNFRKTLFPKRCLVCFSSFLVLKETGKDTFLKNQKPTKSRLKAVALTREEYGKTLSSNTRGFVS